MADDAHRQLVPRTYDAQGNVTSVTDALGNTTYIGDINGKNGYDIANDPVLLTLPATGQTGSGNSAVVYTYEYPDGPETQTRVLNENGQTVETTNTTYGHEGELASVQGSTEYVGYTYDGLYRPVALTDGQGNTTSYYYNYTGFLAGITYPGYTGAAPTFDSSTTQGDTTAGTWSGISGSDSVATNSYDNDGNVLQYADGNSVVHNLAYNDPESLLTGISYTRNNQALGNPYSFTYDGYGRLASANNGVTQVAYLHQQRNQLPGLRRR